MEKREVLLKITREFMFMWILTGVGMFLGSKVSPAIALGFSFLALILIISTYFIKDMSKITRIFYLIPFLMGFSFYYSISFYLGYLGREMVLSVLLLTLLMFIGLGVIGYITIKRDLGGMWKFLLFALLILILVSIAGLFFSSQLLHLLIAIGGIVIFALYIVYDFNRIQHNNIGANETTGYALSLYLDFINLFLHILKLVGILSRD